MTVQEAIHYIEQHNHIDDVVKDMCIEALEKQIKLEEVVERLEEHAIEFEAFGICSDYVELTHAIQIVKEGMG